jgi:hypothetical protein
MTIIKDGTGGGRSARVNEENRLATAAITQSDKAHGADLANTYNIHTGDITLTDANETTVMYIKNNEDEDLAITGVIYNLGATASGTGDIKLDIVRNPTAGDIITNASDVAINSNLNYGSTKTLNVNAYKGATADAVVTDGTVSISTRSPSNTGRIFISLENIVLPKGASLAINYTPPSGNTSQITQFVISCYLRVTDI